MSSPRTGLISAGLAGGGAQIALPGSSAHNVAALCLNPSDASRLPNSSFSPLPRPLRPPGVCTSVTCKHWGTQRGRRAGRARAHTGTRGRVGPRVRAPPGPGEGRQAAPSSQAQAPPGGRAGGRPPTAAHKARSASSALGSSRLCRRAPPGGPGLGVGPRQARGVERRAHRTGAGGGGEGSGGGGGGGRRGRRKRPRAEEGAIEFQTQTSARARSTAPLHPRPPRPSGAGAQPWPRRSWGRGPPSRRGPREGRSAAAPLPPRAQTWAHACRRGAEPGAPGAPPCRAPTGRRSTSAGTWCSPR